MTKIRPETRRRFIRRTAISLRSKGERTYDQAEAEAERLADLLEERGDAPWAMREESNP